MHIGIRILSPLMATALMLAPMRAHADPPVAPAVAAPALAEAHEAGEHLAVEHPACAHCQGEHSGHGEGDHGGHDFFNRFEAGLSVMALEGLHGQTTTTHWGVGLNFKVAIVPHQFEIELTAHIITDEGGLALPVDLLLKKPFVLSSFFHPYVGVGPTLVPTFGGEHNVLMYGFGGVVGADLWMRPRAGMFVELNANGIRHPEEGWFPELGGTVGALIGF